MTRFLLTSFIIVHLLGCATSDKNTDAVLFAGEIVNPTSDHVVLFKGRNKIDSTKLDKNNRFEFHLSSLENGLYHFNLAPEYQYVYLEKGDSLLVRLNTLYFDESLVFSGSNEDLNNFLIELFLSAEEEDRAMYSKFYELEPDDFLNRIKALRNEKITRLEDIKNEVTLSDEAYALAMGSIDYTYNRYKEIYPFQHKRRTTEEIMHRLPDYFYDYRRDVDYNNDNLTYLRAYYDFMKAHFGNLSYMSCKEGCGEVHTGEGKQLHYNKHKLHLIDSLVIDKELRDNLFRNVAVDYLLKKQDSHEHTEIFLSEFKNVSKNNIHIQEIEQLYQGINNLQPMRPIPNLKVITANNDSVTLPEIAKDKKVIFYFWSATNKKQYQDVFKRVAELQSSTPSYEFVGINFKTDVNDWKVILKNMDVNPNSQYHTDNFKQLMETLVLDKMNKAIITENAIIVDGFSNIYQDKF